MTIPKIRRRTYAPKTRTGCVTCKQRRVKCDEQKPTCVRCQARKLECQYDALPKPWIFESSKSPASSSSSSSSSPVIPELHMIARPQAPLNTFCGTPEEQRAVDFYMVKTGPWLANYGPHSHRELWEAVFPRVAASLPATRHLLVAVALLETPAGTQDPATLKTRSQIIMRNYTKALHELTSPGTHYADSGLAPILGWLLESLSWNEARASMHSAGAQHTLEANESMIRFQSKDEFIFDEKMRFILYNIRRFRCMRCKVKRPLQEDTQIFLAVAMRNTPFQPANTKDVREAFQVFVKSYNPPIMTAKDIHEAQEFARRWEFAVVRSRHTSHEPPIIFNALHFLSNVVTLLLPIPVVNKIAGDDTVGIGVDYITDQCYWLLKPLDRSKDTKEALVEIVTMILQLLSRWAPDAERRSRAAERLTELMETGDINKIP